MRQGEPWLQRPWAEFARRATVSSAARHLHCGWTLALDTGAAHAENVNGAVAGACCLPHPAHLALPKRAMEAG